jgi:hypothetical protein
VRLTGIPLLLLAVAATAAAGALTFWSWRRGGRWRPLTRVASVLLLEALMVAGAGLVVNRAEEFYPSWTALAGRTGTTVRTERVAAGRLDGSLTAPAGQPQVLAWRPRSVSRWKLAGVPELVLPAGYQSRPGVAFPVVLALVADPRAALATARRLADVITVVAVPTAGTSAAALADLPAELRRDVRATAGGWDVVAPDQLTARLAAAEPPGFVAARGWSADTLPAPLAAPMRLPA